MSETGKVQVNEFELDMDFTPKQQETLRRIIREELETFMKKFHQE